LAKYFANALSPLPGRSLRAFQPALDAEALLAAWRKLAADGLNNRAAAARLAVTEARLLDCASGRFAHRLRPDGEALFAAARTLGPVKMVVRNDCAVLERPGRIRDIHTTGRALLVEGTAFCCLLDADAVQSAFALRENDKLSVQLFDDDGVSIVKLILRPDSDRTAFAALVDGLRLARAEALPDENPHASDPRPEGEEVPPDALAGFLHDAVRQRAPLRISVSSPHATVQVEEKIQRVKRSDRAPWINVLDPALDLHLFEQRIRRRISDERGLHWLADDGGPALSVG
jgi:putative heme degradation protein